MKYFKLPILYYVIFIIIVVSTYISYEIYPMTSAQEKTTFIVTVLSLVVSTIAFYIAMKTYISIDSVNVITQMEGNVLENENYVISITSLLKDYPMTNPLEVEDAIFKKLKEIFSKKNSRTAIDFTDNLQYFIDIIIFFPALFKSENGRQQENFKNMETVLSLIDQRKKDLLSVSTGNLILIEETVKLINSVINYQQLISTKEIKMSSSLLDVRGTMLKNPVTQTVYFDYLGLFYNKKAMTILFDNLNLGKGDIFEIDRLKEVIRKIPSLDGENVELATMYLKESKKAFQHALENCKNDVMWEGFIKYNDARSTYFLKLVQPEYQGEDWNILMNEAIIARGKLNYLIKDLYEKGAPPTFLQEEFNYQEYLARLVKINILIAEETDINDTLNISRYPAPQYTGLKNDRFIKEPYLGSNTKIRNYQQDILRKLDEA
ncbi:hypothetical protein L1999_26875 [Neobacillus drentensis]|uniref:hypothetical protein n=1 Tax=Neobacillus drentensis TaxID=220684 RepID=UPI001F2544CE|nr:hypothetical protein [Neobacillus drentensis]ULT56618.1 hypothetical protein L1999_26875 [Neobacillus drentensis]